MFANIRTLAGMTGLAAFLLLQGCSKTEPVQEPAASTPAPAAASAPASVAADTTGKPTVEMILAKDTETPPATKFAADIPKIYAFFRSKGTQPGDKLRGAWIAEDVGDAAPKETKIDEATLSADNKDYFGAFSLSKPTKGWPVGKYRVEIYIGENLAGTAKFTVE